MFEGRLIIECPALEALAAAIARGAMAAPATPSAPPAPAAPMAPPIQMTAPIQAPPPVTPAPVVAPTAPAPSFTLEQVGKAGADLITADPTKMSGLLALLKQFDAPSVQHLKPDQLGAFATALRGLGAKI